MSLAAILAEQSERAEHCCFDAMLSLNLAQIPLWLKFEAQIIRYKQAGINNNSTYVWQGITVHCLPS
jgi:hypothetical protein